MDRLKTHQVDVSGSPSSSKILYGDRWDVLPPDRALEPLTSKDPSKSEPEFVWTSNDELVMVEVAL